jgi:hypothetical protein
MATKYTKWQQNIPNGFKIDQMAKNIPTSSTLQNLPKLARVDQSVHLQARSQSYDHKINKSSRLECIHEVE